MWVRGDRMDILAKYQEYATEGTDAPTKYHKFCAAAMLGCLMGRRLWYRQGFAPIFPHLWICLLGRSTWARKSTAISIAERLIAKHDETLIFTSKLSIEKMYAVVSKTNRGMLLYPEIQILQAMMGRDFNLEFKSTLTHWYDAPFMSKYATMGMGEEIIVRRPAISILAGSTMEWLLEAAKTKDIAGGFYPRWLFVHSDNSDVPDKPRPPAASEAKLEAILYSIKNEIVGPHNLETFENPEDRRGQMTFSQTGGAEYDKIYSSWKRQYGNEPIMGAFSGRGLTNVIKLSMISAMGRKRSMTMSPDDVQYAYDLVTSSMNDIREITTYEMADTKTDQNMLKLRKYLKQLGPTGAPRRDLLRNGPIRTPDYLDKILMALNQAGYVTVLPGKRRDAGIYQSLETYNPVSQPLAPVATVDHPSVA
jgi:hypothetical protein